MTLETFLTQTLEDNRGTDKAQVNYTDLLETQKKTEMNTAEEEGERLGGPMVIGPGPPCPWTPFLWMSKGHLSRVAFLSAQEEGITDMRGQEGRDLSKCQRSSRVLAPPCGVSGCWEGLDQARRGHLGLHRRDVRLELGCLKFAAAAGTGAHTVGTDATGAEATRCDGITGATGCADSGAHCQVPAARGAAGTARHWPGAGHSQVPANDPAPGAADTCEPQRFSQNSGGQTIPSPQ